ncbi:hypothetical protein BJ912DRAFT_280077 [Pholiota molesta]|nr:hypothetical protein BJ912DRAFT_280077 [Pholiota molesta]
MLSAPTFVKSARASIQGTWDTAPSAPYIPTPTVGNPLGIRPSSSLPSNQKPIPTAPRSLSAATTAKKPIVVGAKWSAARNSGTSVANISSNGVSASSSSSSISSSSTIPTSPIISTDATLSVTKSDLSQILRYSSPSPPPQPLTEPPPSPPPQSAPSKWKRVNSNDENCPALASV